MEKIYEKDKMTVSNFYLNDSEIKSFIKDFSKDVFKNFKELRKKTEPLLSFPHRKFYEFKIIK